MRKLLFILPLLTLTVFAAATRFQYFETWSTKLSNQDLTISPSGTGVLSISSDATMTSTGALKVPVGTEAQRPTPAAGKLRFNSDSSSFEGYDGSAWGSLGGGGVGAPYIYEVYDFEGAVDADDFTCGTNFSVTNDTSTPLNGNKSIIVAQGATPPTVGVKCTGPNISVPIGARGLKHVVYIPSINGFDDGDIAVNVYDVTNAVELGQASLNASTTKKVTPLVFQTASTTANIRIEFEVLVQNANAVAEFDDIYYQDRLDPVDVTSEQVITYNEYLSTDGSGFVRFGTKETETSGSLLTSDNTGSYTVITFSRDADFTASTAIFGTGISGYVSLKLYNSSGTLRYDNYGQIGASSVASAAMTGFANAGDYLRVQVNTLVPTSSTSATNFSVQARAKENFVAVKGTSVNDVANTNDFSARVDNNGSSCTVITENIDFIDGTVCTRNGTGDCTCSFVGGVFSVIPSGQVVAVDTNTKHATFQSLSTSSFRVFSVNESGSATDTDFLVSFSKQGTDFVTESDKQIIFPDGIGAKFQTKYLSADQSSSGDASDLQFNNLRIGRWYRLSGTVKSSSIGGSASITWWSGTGASGTQYGQSTIYSDGGSQDVSNTGVNFIFQAASTTLYSYVGVSASCSIGGNGTVSATFLTLEELYSHKETTDFN